MTANLYYSIIYAIALFEYLRLGKFQRRILRYYNHILREKKSCNIITFTNGQRLFCDFAHKLPFYQKEFPLYDRQLTEICNYIQSYYNRTINIIDVGANVGDTVLNIGLRDAFYLLFEGNEYYYKFIRPNLKRRYNYSLEKCYLADIKEKNNKQSVKTENGTAKIVNSTAEGERIRLTTLDEVIDSKYKDIHFDLLKIDTDGFDAKVIRGAAEIIQRDKLIIYFEWDRVLWGEQNEDAMSIFQTLQEWNYNSILLFDNYGNYFDRVKVSDRDVLQRHIMNTMGENLPFYYDVLAIPDGKENVFTNYEPLT